MCLSSHSLQVTDFGRSSCHSTDPVLLKCCVSRVSGMKSSQRAERGVEKTGFLLPKALDSSTSCEGNAASLLRPAGTGWLPTGGRPRACSWCCGSGAQDSAPCRRQPHLRPQRPGTPAVLSEGSDVTWERVGEAASQTHHPRFSESKTQRCGAGSVCSPVFVGFQGTSLRTCVLRGSLQTEEGKSE